MSDGYDYSDSYGIQLQDIRYPESRSAAPEIFPYLPVGICTPPLGAAREWKPTTRRCHNTRRMHDTAYAYATPNTRQNRRVRARGRARSRSRVSVCVWRGGTSVSHSLSDPFRPGCMRNEASAPFLAPFLFSPPLPPPSRRRGEDPSYDPYPDPPPPFARRCGRSRRSIQFALRPDSRRGNPRANTLATAGSAYVNILLPLADAPMEIGPPNSMPRISIRGRRCYRCAPIMNFTPFAVGLLPNDILKNRAKLQNVEHQLDNLFIKIVASRCILLGPRIFVT